MAVVEFRARQNGSAGDARTVAHYIATEGKHECVMTVGAAAFNARLTSERQRNKGAGAAIDFA